MKQGLDDGNISNLKRKIRGKRRLLGKPKLSADVKLANERELSYLENKVCEKRSENKQRKLKKRYQMVRFFESKKALRRMSRLRKEFQAVASQDQVRLKEAILRCQVDIRYTEEFPIEEKYISIYGGSLISNSRRDEIWSALYDKVKASPHDLI